MPLWTRPLKETVGRQLCRLFPIERINCPNLLLENMANGNINDIVENCTDVRQENSPAP
jgi:hypothetical protein